MAAPTSDSERPDAPPAQHFGIAEAASAAPIGLAALRPPPPAHPPAGARSGSEGETLDRNYQPDISRFLQATDPQADEGGHDGRTRSERRADKKAAKQQAKDDAARTATTERTDQKAEEEGKTEEDGKDGKDGEKSAKPGGHARLRRNVIRLLVVGVIAATAAILLRVFVVQPYYIPSESMEPTLHGCTGCNDDHILVEKVSYRAHDMRTGDIVVFNRPPGDPSSEKVLIKRVIGIADDTVTLRQGDVYVNGLRIDEPYVDKKCGPHPNRPLTGRSSWHVSSGQLFVMGDNRCDSHDSRAFGPIKTSSVIGRAFMIIWPLDRFGFL